jgi:hypothetical protein
MFSQKVMERPSFLVLVHLDKDPEGLIFLPCGIKEKRSTVIGWIREQNGDLRTGEFDSPNCKCCKFLNYILI